MAAFNQLKTSLANQLSLYTYTSKTRGCQYLLHTNSCKSLNVTDRKINSPKHQHLFLKILPYLPDTLKSYRYQLEIICIEDVQIFIKIS